MSPPPAANSAPTRRGPALPLIRTISRRVLPWIARTPATPNQLTGASLLLGLAAAGCYLTGATAWSMLGAGLFTIYYVLDNCDGDLARMRDACTHFGAVFDTAVDCVVHVALFAAIGLGLTRASGDTIWTWLGIAATTGAAINAVIAMRHALRDSEPSAAPGSAAAAPRSRGEWLLFAFRELSRADFCFLLALATVTGVHGWLLAASAVGAHLYWLTAFSRAARRFHV